MRKRVIVSLAMAIIMVFALAACTQKDKDTQVVSKSTGKIYLYGEQHGVEKILNKELELWSEYYNEKNMRHLFIEMPYYTAEYMNIWMKADNDDILELIYEDWQGTASYNEYTKQFYIDVKEQCPETIFHGTDVGHQYNSTGEKYLKYLKDNGMNDSKQYTLTKEAIEQGRKFYKGNNNEYRENTMVENFKREFDQLENESIMGIYGGAHTGLDAMAYKSDSLPCMANQLNKIYPETIYSENLSPLVRDIEAIREDTINIGGKDYKALYFGDQDLTGFKDFSSRRFWRIENAYEDFKDKKKTGDMLPDDNYPMLIEKGQVFVIDYILNNGETNRMYYRCDGMGHEEMILSEEFIIE